MPTGGARSTAMRAQGRTGAQAPSRGRPQVTQANNVGETHLYQTEREVLALKGLLTEAKNSDKAEPIHAGLVAAIEGLIEQSRKQARLIEDLRSDLTHKQGIVTRIGGGGYNDNAVDRLKEFASSSNGDRWFLGRDETTGLPQVVHQANQPSGGAVTRTSVEQFLARGPVAPEHQALLHMIGTLAGDAH